MVSVIEGQFNIINLILTYPIDLSQRDYVRIVIPSYFYSSQLTIQVGMSVIHYAAITKGNSPAYIRLLASKTDLNAIDSEGNTPLNIAAMTSVKKHYRGMETLINIGADLHLRNKHGMIPSDYVERLDNETKKTADYYTILKEAFLKQGVVIADDPEAEKIERESKVKREGDNQFEKKS